MKKATMFFTLALMALILFVSCGEDPFFHDVTITDRDKVTTEVVFDGNDFTLPANSDAEFLGWKVDDDKYIKAPGVKVTINGETSIKAIYTDTDDDTICLLMYVLTSPDENYSGSFSDSAKKKVLVPTDKVTLPSKDDLVKVEGATFDGWYTAADAAGNRKYYEGGEEITVTTFTKLYANWTDNNLEYVPSNGDSTATVKAATVAASYKVSAWSEGNKVTVVGDFTTAKAQLTTVSLPDTIKKISNSAFKDCTSLTTCNLPSKLETIGSNAFDGCNLTGKIVIPASVTSLGTSAFEDNSKLDVEFEDGIQITEIPTSAFYDCGITSLEIPSTVTSIGSNSFTGNDFTSLVIPASVTSIAGSAFYGCKSLETLEIKAEQATSIGSCSFYGCSKLKTVKIGSGIASMDKETFTSCAGDLTITIQKTAEQIKNISGYKDGTDITKFSSGKAKIVDIGGNEVTGE